MIRKTIAYDLGEIAQRDGVKDCLPFEDEAFTAYLQKYDPPIVVFIQDYVAGFHASNDAAKARRAEMYIIKDDDV